MNLLLLLTSALVAMAATPSPASLSLSLLQTESLRAIKDLTSTFAHLSQLRDYPAMAALFSPSGMLQVGNTSIAGTQKITSFLKSNINYTFDTLIFATPLVNIAADNRSGKGRYNSWRFQGDGKGQTTLQGGIYENEYRFVNAAQGGAKGEWKIEVMRYYPLYEGNYEEGWRNYGGRDFGAVPPFHYTPDEAGLPVLPGKEVVETREEGVEELTRRIEALNDEDEVKNLQHAYGYYLDRRMWTDVEDLFGDGAGGNWGGVFTVDNVGSWSGKGGVRKALEKWMGPEGLKQGVLNEHLIFNTIVSVRSSMASGEIIADSRGIEVALIGDRFIGKEEWRIGFFQNSFVKRNGTWQFLNITIAPLVVANYSTGWGKGGTFPKSTITPQLLASTRVHTITSPPPSPSNTTTNLTDLERRIRRSAAYDGAENISSAYGFYIDFIDGAGCFNMSAIHHTLGHKESPFTGFYQTQKRVLDACTASYGTSSIPSRASISFHWRPQPVVLVSSDGRSASLRARLLQPATARGSGSAQIRGGMYHDQVVLDAAGVWRLWSVTIDEFYWNSGSWKTGWNGVTPRAANASDPGPRDLTRQFPPDLALTAMGERERGFQGGTGRFAAWPDIQKMWFMYRNPVSGREPGGQYNGYWPGCVPCQHRPEWRMEKFGWEEPPTGLAMR
ncbi:hypothetical protein B0H67DRAFT_646026 [Lasiosphaeris hirsuta]|uniref:SnoaL-like domain-containing protein n=1 Tax=Lasiosphaeris hirsuta TaxID=260670 RepID=A0AA40AIC3_9PEZI|nr:hypothetical protein B0H67DRAFT_646026 [Lasiosphaeris hirsuta]